MKKIRKENIQNQFTAYLVKAIQNTRTRFLYKMKVLNEHEIRGVDEYIIPDLSMEQMYENHMQEQLYESHGDAETVNTLVAMLLDNRLVKVLLRLKEQEQQLLYARIFGMKSFSDIGKEYGMSSKQAEMAYYYIIRKIRKQMEGSDE